MFKTLIISATIAISSLTATASSAAGLDGINYLVAVTQMKAANDEAVKAEAAEEKKTEARPLTAVVNKFDESASKVIEKLRQ
jgi:hypothetical protein